MPRLALAVSVSQDMRGHMQVAVTRYHICFLLDDTWLRDMLMIRRREREINKPVSGNGSRVAHHLGFLVRKPE